ncbi:MAG: hypothetical protein ABJL67_24385 [Sulfitobacter sp.]
MSVLLMILLDPICAFAGVSAAFFSLRKACRGRFDLCPLRLCKTAGGPH